MSDIDIIYSGFETLRPSAIEVPLDRPNGGTTYMFHWTDPSRCDDWRADGYRWRHIGSQKIKSAAGSITKTYFQVFDGPHSWTKRFTRSVYKRPDVVDAVVIHYAGDEKLAADFPHGNAKRIKGNFIRTQPSVLRQIEASCSSSAQTIYKELVNERLSVGCLTSASALPRNYGQIKNTLSNKRKITRTNAGQSLHQHNSDISEELLNCGSDQVIKVEPTSYENFHYDSESRMNGDNASNCSESKKHMCEEEEDPSERISNKKFAADLVDAGGSSKKENFTFSSELSLENIRRLQAEFAEERDWTQYHTPRNLLLAMVGEVGEVSELFQWKGEVQVGLPDWSDNERVDLAHELSDVLIYLVRLAEQCCIDLPSAVLRKLELNRLKYPAHLVYGSSKKYNEYRPLSRENKEHNGESSKDEEHTDDV